ncbi:hypothetical protein [Pseudomonas sp.]|uniref:hypothetical protein n=1 Tax=Pseudomonas sp. TaxID=306 RepID=UPI003FD86784
MSVAIPNGMKEVSKEQFFEALYADKRDIMPNVSESENYSVWQTWDRIVWGYSYPGWKYPMAEKAYFIKK